jgi:hypothetical protein
MHTLNSDPNVPLEPTGFDKVQFRRLLGLHFSLEELRTLLFDIGIDFDEVAGETKTARIRELILYAERYHKMDKLIGAARQARPEVDWPELSHKRDLAKQVPLRIFLCHASQDKAMVRELYTKLLALGYKPWLDEEKLLGGQDWELEITKAIRESHVIIVCLSQESVSKAGFVQKEIRFALDRALEQPEGTIFLIPLKLTPCEIPFRLEKFQWVNYYEETGYQNLLRALRARAENL